MDATEIDVRARLLAEMAWVRRLARGLVKDETVADDVAHDPAGRVAPPAPLADPGRRQPGAHAPPW
jgi:hypothetical protein